MNITISNEIEEIYEMKSRENTRRFQEMLILFSVSQQIINNYVHLIMELNNIIALEYNFN